jgi:hypothetical protein
MALSYDLPPSASRNDSLTRRTVESRPYHDPRPVWYHACMQMTNFSLRTWVGCIYSSIYMILLPNSHDVDTESVVGRYLANRVSADFHDIIRTCAMPHWNLIEQTRITYRVTSPFLKKQISSRAPANKHIVVGLVNQNHIQQCDPQHRSSYRRRGRWTNPNLPRVRPENHARLFIRPRAIMPTNTTTTHE